MMTATNQGVNSATAGIAHIRNVALCYDAITRTQHRHELLPGLAVFYGPSGYGKTLAANSMAIRLRAYYLQVKSTWTRKHFLEMLLREMSIVPEKTVARMVDQASSELAKSGRPLIVDEFDHMVTQGKVELVRDIYESSQGTVLLIGEEHLPKKLERWERFHGRVLNWMPAMPVDMTDAKALVPIYSPQVSFSEETLKDMVTAVNGSCRRVCNNLTILSNAALENNVRHIDGKVMDKLHLRFLSGDSPAPRKYK